MTTKKSPLIAKIAALQSGAVQWFCQGPEVTLDHLHEVGLTSDDVHAENVVEPQDGGTWVEIRRNDTNELIGYIGHLTANDVFDTVRACGINCPEADAAGHVDTGERHPKVRRSTVAA